MGIRTAARKGGTGPTCTCKMECASYFLVKCRALLAREGALGALVFIRSWKIGRSKGRIFGHEG